ncbi:hypothetical protein SAMN05443247_02510 [Bradyrhizobium erythrophlei]|jgi:hypothetical protein|nr:hypothetical protein SAMN05443247_02510 [Bradyrhizobium erythrophlei]
MRLTTITLACAVALSSTLALAHEGRHKPGVRAHHAYKGSPPVKPVVLRPNYGNPNGDADGPTTLSGTGSSSFGGSEPGTSGRN